MNSKNQYIQSDKDFFEGVILNFLQDYSSNSEKENYQIKYSPFLFKNLDWIKKIVDQTTEIIKNQDVFIRKKSKCFRIFGDLHGRLQDLLLFFFKCGGPVDIQKYFIDKVDFQVEKYIQHQINSEKYQFDYYFLGDMCDKGHYSLDLLIVLSYLKIKFPNKIYLIRGNHEDQQHSKKFQNECIQKLGNKTGEVIYQQFLSLFEQLPVSIVLNKKYLLLHGFLPEGIHDIDYFRKFQRPLKLNYVKVRQEQELWQDPNFYQMNQNDYKYNCKFIQNESEFLSQQNRLLYQILWNDPQQPKTKQNQNQSKEYFSQNQERNRNNQSQIIKLVSQDYAKKILKDNNLVAIIRAHEQSGIICLENNCIITVFSALNQTTFNNKKSCKANMLEWGTDNKFFQINIFQNELKILFNDQLIIK